MLEDSLSLLDQIDNVPFIHLLELEIAMPILIMRRVQGYIGDPPLSDVEYAELRARAAKKVAEYLARASEKSGLTFEVNVFSSQASPEA